MRVSITVITGLTMVMSWGVSQAQTYQAPGSIVPIVQPNQVQFHATGTTIRGNGGANLTRQNQSTAITGDIPQVQMPTGIAGFEKSIVQDVPAAPADGAQQPAGPALQVQSNAATMPDECYQRGGRRPLGEPFYLFGRTSSGLEVGGWSDTGYYSDSDGLWNTYDDGYRINQAWIYAERKAPRCCRPTFGFRFDAAYGVDAQNFQAFGNPPDADPEGWDNGWDHGRYGWALPQAYGEIAQDWWSVIGGKYISPIGFESIMSPKNFFFSRSYTRTRILPQTLTGTSSTLDLSRDTTLVSGTSVNWDTGFNRFNNSYVWFGGFEYKPCSPVNMTGYISFGDFGRREDGWLGSLVTDLMLTDKVNYINEWTYENSDIEFNFGWAQYLIYEASERLQLGSRFEWFKSTIFTGTADSTYEWTNGFNYRLNANMRVRPELRVDWGEGAADPGNAIWASDLIITF